MSFRQKELPEEMINAMIENNIWNHNCPTKIKDLSLLEVTHIDFDQRKKEGEILVHKLLSDCALIIFEELYKINFPIHSIKTIEKFKGDDVASMQANNSSCFNFRKISGADRLSIHSYGAAIDINPVQNPFITKGVVYPKNSENYLDRQDKIPGMTEDIVHIFSRNKFEIWGGNWQEPIDYHHFEVSESTLNQILEYKSKY